MRLLKLILAVLWTAFIVSALTKTPSAIPRFGWLVYPGVDKIIHAFLFLVEALLIAWIFAAEIPIRFSLGILVFCATLGGGLELVQHYYVEGRTGDWLDFVADAAGAVLGLWIFVKLGKR